MSCCSDRRAAIAPAPRLRAAAEPPPPVEPPPAAAVALRYRGDTPLALRGPFSGRVYRVGPKAHDVDADARDAEALLRTLLFERNPG